MNGANYTIYDGTVKDSNGLGAAAFELSSETLVSIQFLREFAFRKSTRVVAFL